MIENLSVIGFGIGLALLGFGSLPGLGVSWRTSGNNAFVALLQEIPTVSSMYPVNEQLTVPQRRNHYLDLPEASWQQ
jgi:hypothetical protein